MLRAPKNAKKLSENDVHINATIRSFSMNFMRFTTDLSLLQTPRCEKHHEACLKSIAEDIVPVRQHLDTCRAFTADNEAIAEVLSKHIAYVEELIAKASSFHEEAEVSVEAVEEQEETVSSEEEVALRFGRIWEKGGHRRVYLDEKAVAQAVGFELRSVRGTKRYCLGEEEYANATMSKLFKAFDGTYYDLIKKDFVSPSSKNVLLDDFRAVFSSEVEAVKSTHSADPEPGHDEEPVKEEATSTKEKYDPERHIRAAEVKAIFKTLLPHAPSSTRLCIWDITPGLSSGEVYRIGLSYTEEEMGLLARYSHPASTMAISRDVTSDSPYGGLAPVYNPVFDRDVVEGLVATWKASDPVYDRRAQEAARKERAKARKEAQAIRETQDIE